MARRGAKRPEAGRSGPKRRAPVLGGAMRCSGGCAPRAAERIDRGEAGDTARRACRARREPRMG
ncbi:hypothetical protein BOC37_08395 [Burkholderia pseudomallei]|nr:hypothetical protein BOC37_08395 [Burkholderia pseudomallei]